MSIGPSKGFVNIDCLELDDSIQNDYADIGNEILKVGISSQETVKLAPNCNDSQRLLIDKEKKPAIKKDLKPRSMEESKKSHERENSSCKNTVKMTDRRDFSFVESQRESNVPLTNYNLLQGKRPSKQEKPENGWASVNDTVTRLHGINSAQMSNKDPLKDRLEVMAVNPFIHDSQLFVTQDSETKNFGGFLF